MREYANNEAHRRFKVGDRVLLKNTSRVSALTALYENAGTINSAEDGRFTILLDNGAPLNCIHLSSLSSNCFIGRSTVLGANLIRHFSANISLPSPLPSEDEEVADGADDEKADELLAPSGNCLVLDPRFAVSKAPKNFSNAMRNLPLKRRCRKRARTEADNE